MNYNAFINKAFDLIADYYYYHRYKGIKGAALLEPMPREEIHRSDFFVVWYCKTLQNFKALLSTPYDDTRYFEVTYNGDKNEFYFDCYVKEYNERSEA